MATAKTKPVTEEPDPEPATDEKPVTKSDVVEIVKEAISDLLPGKVEATTEETETDVEDTTTMTARQEEQRTHSIVSEAIKAFKEEFSADDSKKADKKEPEAEPGKKPTPWIQRVVWGIE